MMGEFKVVELKTGDIFQVYSVDRQPDKTYFLVWYGSNWKWLDMRKVRLLDQTLWS